MMADPKDRVSINTVVQPELLDVLQSGARVILYETRDLEVEAIVEYDPAHRHWYGVADWSTVRDYDEATGQYLPRYKDQQ
jgi:hypothetical protein